MTNEVKSSTVLIAGADDFERDIEYGFFEMDYDFHSLEF